MIILLMGKSDSDVGVTVAESIESFRKWCTDNGSNPDDDYGWIGGVDTSENRHQGAIEMLIAAADDEGCAEVYETLFDQVLKMGMELQKREQTRQSKRIRVSTMLAQAGIYGKYCQDLPLQKLMDGIRSLGLDPEKVLGEVEKKGGQFTVTSEVCSLFSVEKFGTYETVDKFTELLVALLP